MDILINIVMFIVKIATFPFVWIVAEISISLLIASIYESYQWKKYKKVCTEKVEMIGYISVVAGFFITLMFY